MKPNAAYVSEFENFMNRYLAEHPEVEPDQRDGWFIHWDRKIDLTAEEEALRDSVPDDGYGFYFSAWKAGMPIHPPSIYRR